MAICRNEDFAPISSLCNEKNPMILSPNSLADSKVPRRVPPADHAVQLTPRWSLGFPEADGMGPSLSVTYSGENQPVIGDTKLRPKQIGVGKWSNYAELGVGVNWDYGRLWGPC